MSTGRKRSITSKFVLACGVSSMQVYAVLRICRESQSLSEAGRKLFNHSRTQRSVVNDADRLRKYLLKFGLSWEALACRP